MVILCIAVRWIGTGYMGAGARIQFQASCWCGIIGAVRHIDRGCYDAVDCCSIGSKSGINTVCIHNRRGNVRMHGTVWIQDC